MMRHPLFNPNDILSNTIVQATREIMQTNKLWVEWDENQRLEFVVLDYLMRHPQNGRIDYSMLHHNNAANKMEAPVRPDDPAHFRCSRQSFDRAAVLRLWWDSRNHNARRPGAALDGLTATPLLPRLPILPILLTATPRKSRRCLPGRRSGRRPCAPALHWTG